MNKITTPSSNFQVEPTLFELEPVAGKKVVLDFSAPNLSSVGGYCYIPLLIFEGRSGKLILEGQE